MSFIRKNNAQLFLFINAFLWGSSYVWSKMLLGYLPRFSILFVSSLGGLAATLVMFFPKLKSLNLKTIGPSIIISVFSILSNTFFMLALQYTSSTNTAFIVQMSVIITPLLMALLEKKLPQGKVILAAIIALFGLFAITCDFSDFCLNKGDLFALGNAVFFSIFLAGLNLNTKKTNPIHFTFIHQITNTLAFLIIAVIWELPSISINKLHTPVFAALAGASICVSVITLLFQSTAIKFVRPEKATIIYTFEPVTTLFIAFLFLGEKPDGIKSVAGCLLIVFSVFISLYKAKVKRGSSGSEVPVKPLLQ